jgi:hypothetical protein
MNEMKKYHTIKSVSEGKKKKERATVELGLTRRQVNRLLRAYEAKGKEAFVHGNRGTKPKHAMSTLTKERIIELYQAYNEVKPNIKHFTEILSENYDIHYSDTTIRSIIYGAGILSPKSQRKTRRKFKVIIKKK